MGYNSMFVTRFPSTGPSSRSPDQSPQPLYRSVARPKPQTIVPVRVRPRPMLRSDVFKVARPKPQSVLSPLYRSEFKVARPKPQTIIPVRVPTNVPYIYRSRSPDQSPGSGPSSPMSRSELRPVLPSQLLCISGGRVTGEGGR